MFDSFKRSFGTIIGMIAGLLVGNYVLAKRNARHADDTKNEEEDFVEESN